MERIVSPYPVCSHPLLSLAYAAVGLAIVEFGRNIQIVAEGEAERFVFDPSPKLRWEILKLLDDDFVRSSLTQNRYEVNSKSAIT
jgi:hypothetical protein